MLLLSNFPAFVKEEEEDDEAFPRYVGPSRDDVLSKELDDDSTSI